MEKVVVCNHCNEPKDISAYAYLHKEGYSKRCIVCRAKYAIYSQKSRRRIGIRAVLDRDNANRRKKYAKRRDVILEKNRAYYRNNVRLFIAKNAKRKATKLQATPKWLTKEQKAQITEIYRNAPEGFHVDHIVPLVSIDPITREHIACGLHVPWNLQYLPKEENLKKGQKLTVEKLEQLDKKLAG